MKHGSNLSWLWIPYALTLSVLSCSEHSSVLQTVLFDVSTWVYHRHFYLSFNKTELLVLPLHLFLHSIPHFWHRHLHLIPTIHKSSLVFPSVPYWLCLSNISRIQSFCLPPSPLSPSWSKPWSFFYLFGNPNPLSTEQPGIVLVMLLPCFKFFSWFLYLLRIKFKLLNMALKALYSLAHLYLFSVSLSTSANLNVF